ncbi:MAG: hypothetical protein KKB51_06915 [Candidatus Riflebacteria bacterium]|nr:hypothetical protein [Candidatus Riflebacteria bacterium]
MPFVVPAVAIGAGVSLVVWGTQMFLSNDDSADAKAAEIMSQIPAQFDEYIERVTVNASGVHIAFRAGTPKAVRQEIKNNIRQS